MKPESRFYKNKIYPMLKKLKGARYTRIENSVGSGIPDLNFTYKGKTYWYELKVTKTNHGRIEFRAAQHNWHNKERKAGGNPLCLAYDKKERKIYLFSSEGLTTCPLLSEISNKKEVKDYTDLI